jgi:3-hydroxyisobutyrate dehydrogenase/2-hydroxy-3-oxopropionate reductase
MSRILLVGLGAMGFGMGLSLLKAGHTVYGIDIEAETMARFIEAGGTEIEDRAAAAADAEIAVLVVVNAAQTEAVIFGKNGLAGQMRPGSVIVACATMAPRHAEDFERRLAENGILYLDAPISGGSAKAAAGTLSIMASGKEEAFEKARPALAAMAESVFELGDRAGPGSAMKVVNQLLAGVHVAAAAEAMTFGIGQGIDPHRMLDVISKSAGSSWMFENRGPFIAAGDYRPHSAVTIFIKDLGIVAETARENGLSVTLAETALKRFEETRELGHGCEGDVAVAKLYAREGNVTLPEAADGER